MFPRTIAANMEAVGAPTTCRVYACAWISSLLDLRNIENELVLSAVPTEQDCVTKTHAFIFTATTRRAHEFLMLHATGVPEHGLFSNQHS
jgi:hypothetical protein